MRTIIRALLSGLIFAFIIPHIQGAYFHGGYGAGIIFGLVMALTGTLLAIGVGLFLVSTVGVFIIPVIIFMLLGFWLVPAAELRILAYFWPGTLGFTGWWPAIVAGLGFLVINLIMAKRRKKS
jgi:hypothetical protein